MDISAGIDYKYYIGNMEYNNTQDLEYIHTEEGRVRLAGNDFIYDYYLKDHLGNTRVVFNKGTTGIDVEQVDNYYPFGMRFNQTNLIADQTTDYMYNGKELQEDHGLDWYDYGARFYDAAIGRWHVADPKAELAYNQTPYHYVSNNPILRIDPTGETDFKFDKETGEVAQVGDANDDPDRIVKTKQFGKNKGEVKTYKHGKKKGQNKAVSGLDNIEKGILSDGMNFKTDDNIVQIGGENQPKIEDVENFLVGLSDHVDVEIAAASLSGEGQTDASAVYIDEYAGNTETRANITIQTRYIGNAKFNTHYHSHLSRFDPSDKYYPSKQDYKFKAGQSKYFKRFILLSDSPNGPKKY